MNAKLSMIDYTDAILSSTDQGVFLVDGQDRVYYENAKLLDLLGIKKMQSGGWSVASLFHWLVGLSDNPRRTERELRAARDHIEQAIPIYIFSEGESATFRFQIQLFTLPGGGPKSYTWGGLVRDATAEWQETAYQARYAQVLIRELQLPLAKVKGMMTTHIQNRQYLSESERQRFLDRMYKGIEHSSHLLEEVQELFRIQMGDLSLHRQPTNIEALIHKARADKAPQLAGHIFTEITAGELPTVECDVDKIEQALSAILECLLQRSSAGGKISLCAESEGKEVVLSFTGHTVAIPDEQVPSLFGPFSSETVSRVEQGKQIELGLSLAYEFVLAHEGRMWATNVPGHGLTINLTLPVATQPGIVPETPKPRLVPKRQPAPQVRVSNHKENSTASRTRILVVEDDVELTRLLKLVLERQGYNVLTVGCGVQAMKMVADKKPDLVLLDLQLPDTNGLNVCKGLREFTDIPIIILTANPKREDIALALDMGADDYMTKPFNQTELGARIRANLRRVSPRRTATQNNAVFATGELRIDFDRRQVDLRRQRVRLTPTEYKVLYHLAINRGQVLTYEQLLSKVWGAEFHNATQYLWVCISRLRKKLEIDPTHPQYLLTEQGIGYYIAEEPIKL